LGQGSGAGQEGRCFAASFPEVAADLGNVCYFPDENPARDLLEYRGVAGDPKLPEAPRLPQRAAIYIAPDGTVHFGALFSDLVPVAKALNAAVKVNANPNLPAAPCSES
jgi:hypothetical protein